MADQEVEELQGERMIEGNTSRAQQIRQATLEKSAEEHQAALEKIKEGLATKVRILASHDSCPVCKAMEGAYEFDEVPELPMVGCSHPNGCRCHYEPVLDRFGP